MPVDRTASADAAAVRVIKKYPNRRLYDTLSSSYITLSDVKQMVLNGVSMVVRDAKTQEDITRSILLQIILEEETGGVPMFTESALANIIRFYGHAMQGFMGSYLEKNVQSLIDIKSQLSEQSRTLSPEMWKQFMAMQSPLLQGVMGNYVEQSKNMFVQMQDQLQKQTAQVLGAMGIKH
jgi:polyhydroxyalkanoate synthesis repressor PhaR